MGQDGAGRPLEILLVADDRGDARQIAQVLKQARLLNRLTVMADGEQVLALLQCTDDGARRPLPDLILLDRYLRHPDGGLLLRQIRSDPRNSRLPIVVLVAAGAIDEARSACDPYASDYIGKPLDLDQFLGAMQRIGHFWLSVVPVLNGLARASQQPVLFVGDESTAVQLVAELSPADKPGYVLDTVPTLAAALEVLPRQHHAAVLFDLDQSDSSGLTAVSTLAHSSGQMPLLVIGSSDDENFALATVQLGALDYVIKGRGDGACLARTLRYAMERRLVQEHLEFAASHDMATGLPNWRRFVEALRQLLPSVHRRGGEVAVLVVVLTGLGAVNQALGHEIGDLALEAAVGRMQRLVPEDTVLACTGNAAFALACAEIDAIGHASLLAEQLLDALRQPYRIDDHELYLGARIGMSLSPNDAADAAALLKCAETAVYQAGQRSIGSVDFYSPELNRHLQERLSLERELRHALLRNELDLDFQPIVDSGDRIVSAEALLRWNHPRRGRLAPDRFLALAEQSDLILLLGRWVLARAMQVAQSWSMLLPDPPSIAINVSARQLENGHLLADVEQAVAQSGLSPQRLELELTESVMQRAESRATLAALRELGISIAIDDFGTGFSSLSYLKAFPVDLLKIDRSFVTDATTDPRDAVIVRAIIAMAHILGIDVVAEGVETEHHRHVLCRLGCNRLQGFHIGRPESAERFATRLRQQAGSERPVLLGTDRR